MDGPSKPSALPIMLVGMPGAGKSTVGAMLAGRLGLACHDSDALIEAETGLTIAALFEHHGETRFRELERRILTRLLTQNPSVIAAGGGAFFDPEIRTLALARATVIWLDAPVPVLEERLRQTADRPLLAVNPHRRLTSLKAEREPVYALSPVRIDATPEPDEVVSAILAAIREPTR